MSLKVVPHKNSPYLYLRGSVRGQNVYETTGVKDPALAEEIRIKKEAELLHASIHGERVVRTFAAAAVAYMEAPGAREKEHRFVIPLAEALGPKTLDQITQDCVDAYVKKHYVGRAPSTILRNVITPLTSVLNFAARRHWCDAPKFDRPKQPKGRQRWATHDEAGAILSAAAPHLQPLLIFLLYTGARLSEALDLCWRDVNLSKRWAVFLDTKNGEDRGVPLHAVVVAELERLFEARKVALQRADEKGKEPPPDNVFLTDDGERYRDADREAGGQIKNAFHGACVRAGLAVWETVEAAYRRRRIVWKAARIVPHDLRHTCSTWLLMAGVEARIRDEILGHAAGSMGSRYAHVPVPYLFDAIDRLPALEVRTSEIGVKRKRTVRIFRVVTR